MSAFLNFHLELQSYYYFVAFNSVPVVQFKVVASVAKFILMGMVIAAYFVSGIISRPVTINLCKLNQLV